MFVLRVFDFGCLEVVWRSVFMRVAGCSCEVSVLLGMWKQLTFLLLYLVSFVGFFCC